MNPEIGQSFKKDVIAYLVLRPVLGAGGAAEVSITSTLRVASHIDS